MFKERESMTLRPWSRYIAISVISLAVGVGIGIIVSRQRVNHRNGETNKRIVVVSERDLKPPNVGVGCAVFVYGNQFYDVRGDEIPYNELYQVIPPKSAIPVWFNISVVRNDPFGFETAYLFASEVIRRTDRSVLFNDSVWIIITDEDSQTQMPAAHERPSVHDRAAASGK